jgi:DNA repair photolyase
MNGIPTAFPSPKRERISTTTTTVKQILTRCSGFLLTVSSHSLNPYQGCALGNFLCGRGCYVQHNFYLTKGRPWGSFVDVRMNAAEVYCAQYESERAWAQRHYGRFGVFFSSSTEPFQPAERQYGVTRRVLEAMVKFAPDYLIIQTHSHNVTDYLEIYPELAKRTNLRFHISIESDLNRLGGLPPSFSTVEQRIHAAANLHANGFRVVVTVSPLLPIRDPESFFARLATVAGAVVIDHFIEGDGTPGGTRTLRTQLPMAMERVNPDSTRLAYRDFAVSIAQKYFPGRVGVNVDGFAGRFLPAPSVINLTETQ